jgi:hypothetical protein
MVPEINLLPSSGGKSSGNRMLPVILIIIFGLLVVFLTVHYFSLSKSVNQLQTEQQLLQSQKLELESSVLSLDQPEQVDLGITVQFIESVAYPVSPLLIEINKYIRENTYLREYLFSENEITFSVDFETMADVVTYVGDLTGSSYFADVKVDQITASDTTTSDDEEKTNSFDEVERLSNTFTVIIDPTYIQTGGVER